MKVMLLKTMSGTGVKRVGEVHDFSEDEAERLIEAGIATEDLDHPLPLPRGRSRTGRTLSAAPAPSELEAKVKQLEADAAEREAKLAELQEQLDAAKADVEPDAAASDETPKVDVDHEALEKMKRPDLDALATSLGISEPAELPNKNAVIAAIKERSAS